MGMLSPEFCYAMKRHRGLRMRTKEKFARTIRKHLGETLRAIMVVATLTAGFNAGTSPDEQKTKKPTTGQINSADVEENREKKQSTLAYNL